MTTLKLDDQQQAARTWFESLRDRICAQFEAIERESGSDATFTYTAWDREADGTAPGEGGGGVRGVMKGKVFEKVGVNVSTVGGALSPDFAGSIHGAAEDPQFFATGISLVAHMANPHVPAVHMNTRFLVTTKRWFGGGADLNPPIPYDEDKAHFHDTLKAACDAHDPDYYPRFKKWADDYFFIPIAAFIAAWAASSTIILKGISTRTSLSRAALARPFWRPSRRLCGGGWPANGRSKTISRCWNGAAAMPNSIWSMTGARCSASRPGQYRRDPDEPAAHGRVELKDRWA
jgi:hypothetical protein